MTDSTDTSNSALLEQYEKLVYHLLDALIGDQDKTVKAHIKSGKISIDVTIPEELRGYVIGKGGHMIRSVAAIAELAPYDSPYTTLVTVLD